jgi:hypothetical protein
MLLLFSGTATRDFRFFTAMTLKTTLISDVMTFSLVEIFQSFGGTSCLSLQDRNPARRLNACYFFRLVFDSENGGSNLLLRTSTRLYDVILQKIAGQLFISLMYFWQTWTFWPTLVTVNIGQPLKTGFPINDQTWIRRKVLSSFRSGCFLSFWD